MANIEKFIDHNYETKRELLQDVATLVIPQEHCGCPKVGPYFVSHRRSTIVSGKEIRALLMEDFRTGIEGFRSKEFFISDSFGLRI